MLAYAFLGMVAVVIIAVAVIVVVRALFRRPDIWVVGLLAAVAAYIVMANNDVLTIAPVCAGAFVIGAITRAFFAR